MTDNDNKDPQIREAFEKWYGSSPEKCSKYPNQYLNVLTQARWEAWQAATEQQAAELKQITAEIVQEWKELEILEGNSYSGAKMKILVDAFLQQAAELKQLRAEQAGLLEALDNLANCLIKVWDGQQTVIAHILPSHIIGKHLDNAKSKLTDSAQSGESK